MAGEAAYREVLMRSEVTGRGNVLLQPMTSPWILIVENVM
jgi:hypothetical protein